MIGLKEAAALIASAILFVSSLLVPIGDQGAVAIQTLDDGGTHAVAPNAAPLDSQTIKLYDLIVSEGTPLPPATIDEPVSRLTGIVAPDQGEATLKLGGERLTLPAGARVTIENATGPISLEPDDLGTEVTLSGAATDVEIRPPETPAVSTHAGSQDSVPVTSVSIDGRELKPGFRDAGVFDRIQLTGPQHSSGSPHLLIGGESIPFGEPFGVQIEDFVGVFAVVDSDEHELRVHLEGFASIRIGQKTYGAQIDEGASVELPSQDPANDDPRANFTFRPTSPHANETVHFVDESKDDLVIRDWHWDFDDGTTSHHQNPQHRFPSAGVYDVTLTVTDAGGKQSSKTLPVVAENTPPRIEIEWDPLIPVQTESVYFTADVEDPDSDVISVEWSFSDGETLSGREVKRSFFDRGDYTVNVTATDTEGNQATDSAQIHVDNAPPTANFTVDPENPVAGEPVTLHSTSEDVADGSIVEHTFRVDGVGERTGETVTVEFPHDGQTTVSLTVTDDDGAETTTERTVEVQNPAPNVSIDLHPVYPNPGQSVDFVADVDDDDRARSAEWTFSDGVTRTGLGVSRTFPSGGNYTATVEVEDADGATATATRTFPVNHLPSLTVAIPGEGVGEEETAVLTGNQLAVEGYVSDPDGNQTEIRWTVDGTAVGLYAPCQTSSLSNGSRLECSWPDDGTHLVEATAQDTNGGTSEHRLSVLVLNRKPHVSPEVRASSVQIGDEVTFDSNASDPDGIVTEVRWFVDGDLVGKGLLLNHTFQEGGVHRVVANATDDDGASEEVGIDVDVNTPPTVDLSVSSLNSQAGETVTFSADAQDPDGPDGDLAYSWRFGDGAQAQGATVDHTYDREGEYEATVTVTDVDDAETNESVVVDVDAPPIAGQIHVSSSTPQAGQTVQFEVDPDGQRTIESVEWTFGDGNTTTTDDATVGHVYAQPRTVDVVATVDTADGASGSIAQTVRVTGAEPHRLRITPHLPDGNCLNFTSPEVSFQAKNLHTEERIALSGTQTTWTQVSDCTLEASFSAGSWSVGDGLRITGAVGEGHTREFPSFNLDGDYVDPDFLISSAPLFFEEARIEPRDSDPLVGSGSDDRTTYHDPTEPVHARGLLRWGEGTLVENYDVQLTASYSGPQTVVVGQGIEYRQVTFTTDADGQIDVRVPAPIAGAAAQSDDPDDGSLVYPPGRYEVRLQASSQLRNDVVSLTFIEDPEGIFDVLGAIEIGVDDGS